jgi:hypothetical protein
MDWFFGGCRALVPRAWDTFLENLSPEERQYPAKAYYARLTHEDPKVQLEAARSWVTFEFSLGLGKSQKLQVCRVCLMHQLLHAQLACYGLC